MTVLGQTPPPAGGIDVALPGNGVRLAGTRWPGEGTPVLLLHGLASQRRFWNLVVAHLSGLPLLAVDQRGHGDSDRPETGYLLDDAAGDLPSVLDALGWSRAVVVGHSWGAAVAATFARLHPERCLALVAIDGGFSSPLRPGADRATVRTRLEPPRLAMPPEEIIAMISTHSPGPWTDELAAAVLPIFEVGPDGLARARLPFDKHMAIVDGLLDYDATATLPAVTCPAWLVSCEAPDDNPEWREGKGKALDALVGRVRRLRAMRWGGAVHDVPLQWPALVAGLIRSAAEEAAATPRSAP